MSDTFVWVADFPHQDVITALEDSRRWRHVRRRPGDIIISAPPASGSAWMQRIVRRLLSPQGADPDSIHSLSPWVEFRLPALADLVEALDTPSGPRLVTSHSPGDCIPVDHRCRYIVVYRDGKDAFVSWTELLASTPRRMLESINETAASVGVAPLIWEPSSDQTRLFRQWREVWSAVRHLAGWWGRRSEPHVLFVHHADMLADLEAEMRRVAVFIDVDLPAADWTHAVAACELSESEDDEFGWDAGASGFDRGADAMPVTGSRQQWRSGMDSALVSAYETAAEVALVPRANRWLAEGSLAVGYRPDEDPHRDQPRSRSIPPALSGRPSGRPRDPASSIAERRVDEARAHGFFDGLAGAGEPIADIDRPRPAGWWANRLVQAERDKARAAELEAELQAAIAALWRRSTADSVARGVDEVNRRIAEYNRLVDERAKEPLDRVEALATWRRLRSR